MTGTGFVAMRDLPESDEEDEGDETDETQAESHKQMQAVGTRTRILNGYVLVVLVLLCAIWIVFSCHPRGSVCFLRAQSEFFGGNGT